MLVCAVVWTLQGVLCANAGCKCKLRLTASAYLTELVAVQALKPAYADAAAELAEADVPVTLAKVQTLTCSHMLMRRLGCTLSVHIGKQVDATENQATASKYQVKGYPTLFWFVNGKPQPFTGGRTSCASLLQSGLQIAREHLACSSCHAAGVT